MTSGLTDIPARSAPPHEDVLIFPASAAQQRLWLAADADRSGAAYNITRAVAINGTLDAGALRRAVAAVVDRHEALRTVFLRRGGTLHQVVRPGVAPVIDVHDLRGVPPAERDRACDAVLEAEATRPFDLTRGPLLQLVAVRLEPCRSLLCLNVHHIVCDAWSLSLLFRELTAAYRSAVAGRRIDLGPLPLQYADFAVWQHDDLAAAAHIDASLAFWRGELAALPPLPLPTDLVRPKIPTALAGVVTERLERSVTAELSAIARAEKTTPFVVLLAAYAAFLHRWTGATDIPVGTPVTGRDRTELEGVVGPFVNTVVARIRIDPADTFTNVVAKTRHIMLAALEHGDAPFDAVAAAVSGTRAAGSRGPFRTMFAVYSAETCPDADIVGDTRMIGVKGAKHDLTVVATVEPDALALTMEYDRDLFLAPTIEQGLAAFARFMRAVASSPAIEIVRASWLALDHTPVAFFEGRATVDADGRSIYQRFADVAAQHAGSTAIEDGSISLTYAALHDRANRIAALLAHLGVRRGGRVALVLPRGAAFAAAALGALKIGAAYVPLDPESPESRAHALLHDARPSAVLREADVAHALDTALPPPPTAAAARSDPAAIIYTSGSTGTPKGVVVAQRGIMRLVVQSDYLPLRSTDRVAHASNVAFDAATFEIFGALLNGATLVVIRSETLASPRLLERAIAERALSVMFTTTAVFNQVARDAPGAFAPLRALLFGGETSSPTAAARVVEAGKPQVLLHMYGPTESTTFATAYAIDRVDTRAATLPIGRPIAGTRARLFDSCQRPVPQGVVGELHLGGDGLALEYHGDRPLTSRQFIPDPFMAGERLYRTGDRCRITAAGELEFIERADRQLKLRGFRIEPAEVEHALCADSRVAQGAVGVQGTGDERRLVAAVVLSPDCTATPEQLRISAAARLPSFMVPSSIDITDALPLTPNGKVDRQQIAEAAAQPAARAPVPARDPLESDIACIWEQMLGVSPVGITDDFFSLGGHSLLAASMLDRVEELVGRRIPMSAFLGEPTVERLASVCWRAETESARPLVVMRDGGERPPFFYIHGDINGAGVYSRRLMRALPMDQPFYAFGPPAGGLDAAPSIEAMAAYYAALIRDIRPEGAVAVGGYCHGALAAYEIARRLARERPVTSVVMVRPSRVAPELRPVARAIDAFTALRRGSEQQRVRATVRAMTFLGALARLPTLQVAPWLAAKVRRFVKKSAPRGVLSATPSATERHDPDTWATIIHAVQAFVPRRYDGRVALLLTSEADERARGWMKIARRSTVGTVPGDHRTCVTTHVDDLAAAIDRELADAAQFLRTP